MAIRQEDGRLELPAQTSARSVLVLDPLGEVFHLVREMELSSALWRVVDHQRVASTLEFDLLICAQYAPPDWDVIRTLSNRGPVIIVTTAYERAEAEEAVRRGLVGYLDASLPRPALARAVRGALVGTEVGFSRDVIGAWMRGQRHAAAAGDKTDGDSMLTRRQSEIVRLIASGATDKEIAATLGIAHATAQKHVTNILQRLRVRNRAAAVAVFAGHRRAS